MINKTDLIKMLENKEPVWVVSWNSVGIISHLDIGNDSVFGLIKYKNSSGYVSKDYRTVEYDKLFKSKESAEHYLAYSHKVRYERLPYVDWETFDKNHEEIKCRSIDNKEIKLCAVLKGGKMSKIKVVIFDGGNISIVLFEDDYCEKHYYNAYKVMCDLFFKGAE